MRACVSLAVPWTTLIRSNTTRRSAPMTRSRLRRPTSKSTTTTFCPAWASAAPSAAVEVVLPTPPLPDVTTITFAISLPSYADLIERRHHDGIVLQPGLDRPAVQARVHVVRRLVPAVDRQQFG